MTSDKPSFEEMIEQARRWQIDIYGEGKWFNAMADWMESAQAELDQLRRQNAMLARSCSRYFDEASR